MDADVRPLDIRGVEVIEIVDADDLLSSSEQTVDQLRTDKARPTCY